MGVKFLCVLKKDSKFSLVVPIIKKEKCKNQNYIDGFLICVKNDFLIKLRPIYSK